MITSTQKQQLKKKVDDLARGMDTVSDPNLDGLFQLIQQVLEAPERQQYQAGEHLAQAVQAVQQALPDFSGLPEVSEAAQSLLEVAGELLSGLGDGQ